MHSSLFCQKPSSAAKQISGLIAIEELLQFWLKAGAVT
jgi:hypothetical protein